jgi:hypothetical protein
MTPDEKIDSVSAYRGIRAVKEGSVFAKYKVKKRLKRQQEETEEEQTPPKKESSEHKNTKQFPEAKPKGSIDIEA